MLSNLSRGELANFGLFDLVLVRSIGNSLELINMNRSATS